MPESGDYKYNQLDPIHLLPAQSIRSPSEYDLANNRASGCCSLNSCLHVRWYDPAIILPERDSEHLDSEVDGKKIIAVCKEPRACNRHGSNMVPAERNFVNLSES